MAGSWCPTHLLLCSPITEVLHWAVDAEVETLPIFADSFRADGLRQRIRYRRLAAALNDAAIRWVANHGRNAATDLVRIGVKPDKVLPFDWPALLSPTILAPKKAPAYQSPISLTYVGQVVAAKGVGDVIAAVAIARKRGKIYRAMIIGRGEIEKFRRIACRLGVQPLIDFTGPVAHERVLKLMNEGEVVVVPSRPEFPEGVPQTIYEGLASRTPVVVSDHPMFEGRVVHRESGMVFRAASPQSLFDTIDELTSDRTLYEGLSANAEQTCRDFHEPLKWDQVISRWLESTSENDGWLRRFALAH